MIARPLHLIVAVTALAVFGLLIWSAAAQPPEPPVIDGRVADVNGRPVQGATVRLLNATTGASTASLTGNAGEFSFRSLTPGNDYEVRAENAGLVGPVRTARFSAGERAGFTLKLRAAIEFEDVAARSGLNFTLRNGETGRAYQPEIMLGGVAAFDYDNDGCTDLLFTNGGELPSGVKRGPEFHNRLFHNNCDGTFTDTTARAGLAGQGYSMGAGAGDYDNDGFVDLFVTGLNGGRLYRNRGDGTFDDVTLPSGLAAPDPKFGATWSISAGWFDFDNDGNLDLFITNYVAWKLEKEGECSLNGAPYYCHPRAYQGLPSRLFRNNGDGTFSDVSETSGIRKSIGKGMGVAFGDFNGDNRIDVFVANDSVPNFLFQNLGNGQFREVGVEAGVAYLSRGLPVAGMGADFRDYDNDGLEDIAADAMYFDTCPLFRNRGKAPFFEDETISSGVARATHQLTGWGMGLFDFDNDGYKDLFFATSHFPGSEPFVHVPAPTSNRVLRNNGSRFFDDVSAAAGPDFQQAALYRGAAFADFDNDGRIDVAVSAVNGRAHLFRNVSPPDAHWIAFRLTGTKSNRQGLGAWSRSPYLPVSSATTAPPRPWAMHLRASPWCDSGWVRMNPRLR